MAPEGVLYSWQRPWHPVHGALADAVPPILWLLAKIFVIVSMFLWIRATFPRYRYDQIMRLGWKIFIPVTIIWIFVEGVMWWLQVGPWSV